MIHNAHEKIMADFQKHKYYVDKSQMYVCLYMCIYVYRETD